MLRIVDVVGSVELGKTMVKSDDCVGVGGCGRYPLQRAFRRMLK